MFVFLFYRVDLDVFAEYVLRLYRRWWPVIALVEIRIPVPRLRRAALILGGHEALVLRSVEVVLGLLQFVD